MLSRCLQLCSRRVGRSGGFAGHGPNSEAGPGSRVSTANIRRRPAIPERSESPQRSMGHCQVCEAGSWNIRFIWRGGARDVREVWQPGLWLEHAEPERIPLAAIPAACGHSRRLASEIMDRAEQLVRERSRWWPSTCRRCRQAGSASGVCGTRADTTSSHQRERTNGTSGDRGWIRTSLCVARRPERSLEFRRGARDRTADRRLMAVRYSLGGARPSDYDSWNIR